MLAACGSRTGLGILSADENVDVVTFPHDAAVDAPADARDASSPDALPPIDANRRDVDRTDCPDADGTLVYLVTSQNELLSFHPPTLAFRGIGNLTCPAGSATPYSMAVDRRGVAYVLFTDGRVFRVSTATAACTPTPYRPDQLGFHTFGMGFASNTGGPDETLYVAEAQFDQQSRGLGRIEIPGLSLRFIGPFQPRVGRAELTGTPDGRLFVLALEPQQGARLAEVDKTNARVIASDALPIATPSSAFAFAHWGGEFWIFTATGSPSQVHRYRLDDRSTTLATTHPSTIVGAGVSTCAPP
jgi:hypothetical protein